MKRLSALIAIILLSLPAPTFAHRLDEYLQATLLSVENDRVEGSLRLVPGVAVFDRVIAGIDANGDGVLTDSEQREYAQRVLNDLSLRVDGATLTPRLVSVSFPKVDEMREGLGEIQIGFTAGMPRATHHELSELIYENHHQSAISAYLVNCLVPRDPNIRIAAQVRNEDQSVYRLQFGSAGSGVSLSGFGGAFRLGMRHIAEGTDHLLFLLTLLLVAPLLTSNGRWSETAGVRQSVTAILRIVTSFTVGHSLTLMLAALGWVQAPAGTVEVLVAVSIFVSALHALRPLFPHREAVVAGCFGLVHGLAFASVLSDLGMSGAYRIVSLVGFNLGIEFMQLFVVVAALPLLLMLSRTNSYAMVRGGVALLAGLVSLIWIVERAAREGWWIALGLFLVGLLFTAVTSLVELVEEASGAVAGQRADQMRLAFFD